MNLDVDYLKNNLNNGIVEVKLDKWEVFNNFLSKTMIDHNHYIWRGQRLAKWKLESTLDRILKDKEGEKRNIKFKHLNKFKYAARGRRGNNPPNINSENEWWALGQHHGLSTPLLDWTTSPYVATYFSYYEEHKEKNKDNNNTDRAIFALNKVMVEDKSKRLIDENPYLDNTIEFINPLSDDNPRLVNQSGLFTKAPLETTIEEWINNNFKESEQLILLKVVLPNSERELVLKLLNRMNINHLTLFPDLMGASKFNNMSLKINNY